MRLLLLGLLLIGTVRAQVSPYPFYDIQKQSDGQENFMTILNSGLASYVKRINLIRKAKDSIELEYYVFNKDFSGKVLIQELVKAVNRGVKVRLLIDNSVAAVKFDRYDAEVLIENGINFKFYNSASNFRLSAIQYRNHRKVFIIDNMEAIVGGRNISDKYYEISREENYLDRDIFVTGPIVKTIKESFNKYFNNQISNTPKLPKSYKVQPRNYFKKKNLAMELLVLSQSDQQKLVDLELLGNMLLSRTTPYICPVTTFSTDRPGATPTSSAKPNYSNKFRYLRKTIQEKVAETNKRLTIESPYFLTTRATRKILRDLNSKGVDIKVYTNSLGSSSQLYISSNLYSDIKKLLKIGIDLNLHQGSYYERNAIYDPEVKKSKWGIHSKTILFESDDNKEFMIGSYNIDNRSSFFNTELGLFCKGSDDLFEVVQDDIENRINKGMKVISKQEAKDNETNEPANIYGYWSEKLIKMKILTLPFRLIRFLL
jgi:putative cardiolipin synthase